MNIEIIKLYKMLKSMDKLSTNNVLDIEDIDEDIEPEDNEAENIDEQIAVFTKEINIRIESINNLLQKKEYDNLYLPMLRLYYFFRSFSAVMHDVSRNIMTITKDSSLLKKGRDDAKKQGAVRLE